MKDLEKNSPDYSQMSPNDTYVKLNINNRSLSVYEQYLKKTIEDLKQDRSNENSETNSAANYKDYGLKENIASPVDEHRLYPTVKTIVIPSDSPSSNAKLLMIMAVFCAALLVALVVILFNATDTLVSRISSVDTKMSKVSDNLSVIGKENSLAAAQAIANERATNAANAENLASVKDSLNSMAMNAEIARAKSELKMATRMRSMQLGETSVEPDQTATQASKPAISYDTFKKESQTVVYRESSK